MSFFEWIKGLSWYAVLAVAQVICVGIICSTLAMIGCAKYDSEARKVRYENQYKSDEAFWGRPKCNCGCSNCACKK